MTTIAIGYAYSKHINDQSHIAPSLFYNEVELDHINWVNTIYPKFNDPEDSLPVCNLQLTNYLGYYHKDQVIVIGGDLSALNDLLITYESLYADGVNLILVHEQPEMIQTYINQDSDHSNSRVFTSKNLEQLARQLTTSFPEKQTSSSTPSILVIDASYWSNQTNSPTSSQPDVLKLLEPYHFNLILVSGYAPNNDPNKIIFNQLKNFIQKATS